MTDTRLGSAGSKLKPPAPFNPLMKVKKRRKKKKSFKLVDNNHTLKDN